MQIYGRAKENRARRKMTKRVLVEGGLIILSLKCNTKSMYMCTCIFHVRPHSMARLIFIGEKLVLKKLESPLILFYFKRENKTRKKTLKK